MESSGSLSASTEALSASTEALSASTEALTDTTRAHTDTTGAPTDTTAGPTDTTRAPADTTRAIVKFIGDGSKQPTNWHRGYKIGEGGFGKVYKVKQRKHEAQLVVKQLKLQKGVRSFAVQIRNEISILEKLEHCRIVKYVGFCTTEQCVSLFMEYLQGGSLDAYLYEPNNEPLDEFAIRSITRQMLEGVSYLHQQRIIHRDIKAGNVLLSDYFNIKLADFGLSKAFKDVSKAETKEIGTVYWMAPEMFSPMVPYSYGVDIWSTGCTVVEMITRERPFPKIEKQQMPKHMNGLNPSPATDIQCSDLARDFLDKIFKKDEKDRPSANALLKEHPFVKVLEFEGFTQAAETIKPETDMSVE